MTYWALPSQSGAVTWARRYRSNTAKDQKGKPLRLAPKGPVDVLHEW